MTTTHHSEEPAGLGHNQPPEPTLPERLADTHSAALIDVDALAEKANNLPKEVATDADRDKIADVAADAGKHWKALDGFRIAEKAPFLKAERDVDTFFREPLARTERIEKALTQRVTLYNRAQKKKADDARIEEERKQRAIAAAAAKAAEEAAAAGRVEDAMADVEFAHEAAAKAEEIAAAPIAEPEPVKTAGGTTIGTNVKWMFEITDLSKIDLEALRPFIKPEALEAAIRAFVRINKGGRQIAGVRIFEDDTAQIRR